MESKVYNQEGKEVSSIELPKEIFGLPWNGDLVHQVVVSMQSNAREPIAHTKTRGEVAGGGKKPWRQKGTGRARHGSIRSPIWVGGGITHGPRNDKDFSRKVNRKMKAKALFTILSKKLKDKEIMFVDSLSFSRPKTKDARQMLSDLSGVLGFEYLLKKKNNSAVFAIAKTDKNTELSLRNMANISVLNMKDLNPVTVLTAKYIVFSEPKEAISFFGEKLKS